MTPATACRMAGDGHNAHDHHQGELTMSERNEGCDCTELCSMGPTCPGGMLAGLSGSGCWRMTCPDGRQHSWSQWPDRTTRCRHCGVHLELPTKALRVARAYLGGDEQ